MRVRRDAVTISGMLFTVALLMLAPAMINSARVTYQSRFQDIAFYPEPGIAPDQVVIPNYYAPVGITSLAIIAIGLVVTWAGYVKAVRWTWWVMFVIVWAWAFPVLMLPMLYPWHSGFSVARTLTTAIRESGMARSFVELVLVFLGMVVALVLPLKRFILGRGAAQHASSSRGSAVEGAEARAMSARPVIRRRTRGA
jgi:hypothetical protein